MGGDGHAFAVEDGDADRQQRGAVGADAVFFRRDGELGGFAGAADAEALVAADIAEAV